MSGASNFSNIISGRPEPLFPKLPLFPQNYTFESPTPRVLPTAQTLDTEAVAVVYSANIISDIPGTGPPKMLMCWS